MCRRGKKSRKQLDKNTINIKEAVSKTNIKYGFIDMYPGKVKLSIFGYPREKQIPISSYNIRK